MNTAVTKPQTLQERVGARIRDQIGDLMTDEDLKMLVDKALHDAFFTQRREQRGYGADILHPPAVVELVRELLKERVDKAAAAWLAEHKDELGQHIDDAIGKGMLRMFTDWLDQRTQGELIKFGEALRQSLGIN